MKKFVIFLFFLAIFSIPQTVFAQAAGTCGCTDVPPPLHTINDACAAANVTTPEYTVTYNARCTSNTTCTCDSTCTFLILGAGSCIYTALGGIPTEPAVLVKWILKFAILMGGGIAFLLSLWGGVTIVLAGGNPEKINSGKEIISSALTGLFIIIFSVFLLRLIGYDILQLPGFKP